MRIITARAEYLAELSSARMKAHLYIERAEVVEARELLQVTKASLQYRTALAS